MSGNKSTALEVWHIATPSDPDLILQLSKQLSDEEQKQAHRLIKRSQRHTYISSHAAMRDILAKKLSIEPERICYQKQAHGKPYLDTNDTLFFNLSHSHGYALLGVSHHCELGIDIEKKLPHRDLIAIAERFFTPDEYQWLNTLPTDSLCEAFYQLWCHKEAFLKATGQGITAGLQHINLSWQDFNRTTEVQDINQQDWYLHTLEIEDNFNAALAVNCKQVNIHSEHWHFS